MMIPSEMPVLSHQRAENGHSFPDNQNVFQNPDLFRSGLFSQLGSDQMQILQNLQQMGQKQKEVCRSEFLKFPPKKYFVPRLTSSTSLLPRD